MSETIGARLRAAAARRPAAPALLEGDRAVTYAALDAAARRVARLVGAAGAGPGARIALLFPNGSPFMTAFFGTALAGAVAVPLNPAFTVGEAAPILDDARASLILAAPGLVGRASEMAAAGGLGSGRVQVVDEPGGETAEHGTGEDRGSADAPLICLYSSGSTGRPKRVERSHRQIGWEVDALAAAIGLSAGDRVLGAAPFCHTNGLFRSMVASALAGAALVPVPQFERRAVGRLIQRHRVSVFVGVPFMFAMLAETRWPEPIDLSSLRLCLSASAPLKAETRRRFLERFGVGVRQLYGTTETGTIALDLDGPEDGPAECVGEPLPGIKLGIFSENRAELPAGEVGEIGIASPAAVEQYPDRPEQSAESFRGGYFFPGDLGRVDAVGRLHLLGRKSLFINRGGFKVNPYEIEQVLEEHADVREAAVVGVETEFGDQKIRAVVVTRRELEPRELLEFCRTRLADYKVPSLIELRDALPKSAAGKLLRKEL